ncbi:Hypothetical protein PFREUD_21370 [Propionibacterium freudenreichii subsp. shermanii CIRM-BIA1]|uniref:Uncharacterized protein n=1 Tax=Propionibacterium freudenreichii subsp. shermanii (strain ATCC 9614 / DSM 4902 / CIP 103027 / NCIMB 8099 / CIRM-BIA1) TaxID=754252 RepID=D7GGH8_PROFC|nr:Hypothetical protein PFREUD_21370 [Propionibacterium freudenreichii subsp. shermanii CIRM-BIA1]
MPVPDLDVVEFADLLRPLPPHLPIPEASEASQRQNSDSQWPTLPPRGVSHVSAHDYDGTCDHR